MMNGDRGRGGTRKANIKQGKRYEEEKKKRRRRRRRKKRRKFQNINF